MAGAGGNPPLKTHKLFFSAQITLRVLALGASVAAAWIMLTNKQRTLVYGIWASASYSYSSAFKFFASANLIGAAFSVLSLFIASLMGSRAVNPTNYFYLFLHDLIITLLLMAGCAAATAVGFVGKYGVSEAGWLPLCDHFATFCRRTEAAAVLGYLSMLFYLVLTVISANKSRQIQV